MLNYAGHSRTTSSPRRTRSRSVPPPLKGILKANHSTTTSQSAASTWPSWPLSSSPPCPPTTTSCCCCKSITNEWDQPAAVMHPDDPERNYVSHCHTENRLWRPEAVVIHHRDSSLNVASAASKPQLQQMPNSRVSHDPILHIC